MLLSQYPSGWRPDTEATQSTSALGPATTTPTSVAAAPEASAAAKVPHLLRTNGHRSTGANWGFTARTNPRAAPDASGFPLRSATHATTKPKANSG